MRPNPGLHTSNNWSLIFSPYRLQIIKNLFVMMYVQSLSTHVRTHMCETVFYSHFFVHRIFLTEIMEAKFDTEVVDFLLPVGVSFSVFSLDPLEWSLEIFT